MIPTDEAIDAYQSNRQLVSFRRDSVDKAELQGFILRVSERLILLQHVRDFILDGHLLLDRNHITNARCHSTNRFQRQLLESNGTIADVDFECDSPIGSWMEYLTSIADDSLVIIEQELSEPPFVHYGTFIDKDDDDFIRIHEFSGAANWDDELTLIPMEDITCIQTDTNYLRPYQRYFKINPRPQIAG